MLPETILQHYYTQFYHQHIRNLTTIVYSYLQAQFILLAIPQHLKYILILKCIVSWLQFLKTKVFYSIMLSKLQYYAQSIYYYAYHVHLQ